MLQRRRRRGGCGWAVAEEGEGVGEGVGEHEGVGEGEGEGEGERDCGGETGAQGAQASGSSLMMTRPLAPGCAAPLPGSGVLGRLPTILSAKYTQTSSETFRPPEKEQPPPPPPSMVALARPPQ